MKIRLILGVIFLFSIHSAELNADIITAASCSQTDVQAAIDSAKDGDTVMVPAGTATWTKTGDSKPAVQVGKQLTWNPPTFESKAITLYGAGVDTTIIIDQCPHNYNESALLIFTESNKPVRVTGFTFSRSGEKAEKGTLSIIGECKNWRIDHCKLLDAQYGNGIVISGNSNGVIDHCVFTTGPDLGNFKALSVNGTSDGSWDTPLSLGTINAIFVEDCIFEYNFNYAIIDLAIGGRCVLRHNTIYNAYVGSHGHDSDPRAMISYEIYNNSFSRTIGGNMFTTIAFRGGTGVVYDNTVENKTGTYNSFIDLYYYCACPEHQTCGHETCTEYPCWDQPGRAPDADGDSIQDLEPVYEWGNTFAGGDGDISVADICEEVHEYIQEGRDFYNDTERPDYTPFTYPHPLTLGITGIKYNSTKKANDNIHIIHRESKWVLIEEIQGLKSVEIFDLKGRQIAETPVISGNIVFKDMKNIGNGCYILSLKGSEGVITRRFVFYR